MPYNIGNVVPACYTCNAARGTMPLDDYIAMRQLAEPDWQPAIFG